MNERTARSSAPHGHQDGVQHELVMNRASAAQRRAPHAARADLTSRISPATRHLLQVSPRVVKDPGRPVARHGCRDSPGTTRESDERAAHRSRSFRNIPRELWNRIGIVGHGEQVLSRLNGSLVALLKPLPGAGRYCKRKPRTGTRGELPMDGVESKERSLITAPPQRAAPCASQASLGKPSSERPPWHTCHTIVPVVTSL